MTKQTTFSLTRLTQTQCMSDGEPLLVEDVLAQEQYQELLTNINGNQFGWYFLSDHNYGEATEDEITRFGFRHLLIANNQSNSNFSYLVLPIVFSMQDAIGKKLVDIVSIHANMTINVGKQHDGHPHTDCRGIIPSVGTEMYSAVYYLDSCDGDTVFYADDLKTIVHRQTPKANSMVIFPRDFPHSAMLPVVSARRRIVNINITVGSGAQ